MKKKLLLLMFFVLLALPTYSVAAEEAIAKIYSTDILAYVKGEPIEGFNIGGKTVVIAEDLSNGNYGFFCSYSDEERLLEITPYFVEIRKGAHAEIPRGKTGKVLGDVYKTDIKVTYGGEEITGYNIGGRTAICLEELGDLTDSPHAAYGYSKHLARTVWDEDNRAVYFDTYYSNNDFLYDFSRVEYTFCDNVLYVWANDTVSRGHLSPTNGGDVRPTDVGDSYYYSENFTDKNKISPLYISAKGEKFEIGTAVCTGENEIVYMDIQDINKASEVINSAKNPLLSYDEAYSYYTQKYPVKEIAENENFTILSLRSSEGGTLTVAIKKDGGVLLLDNYSSYDEDRYTVTVSISQTENIAYVTIDPWGGPHGPTTMTSVWHLDECDFS